MTTISPSQREALLAIERGDVFYKPHFGRIYGIRNDTYDALERRAFVEIRTEDLNPGARPMAIRWAVALTDAGRDLVASITDGAR